MKKICCRDSVFEYAAELMNEKEKKKYQKHLGSCPKCKILLDQVLSLRNILDYRKKIKHKLPLARKLQYPEKSNMLLSWKNILAQLKNNKPLKYAISIPLLIILIFSTVLFLMKRDIPRKAKIITKEKKQEKITGSAPGKLLTTEKIPVKRKEETWCFNTGGPFWSQPVLNNDILYFGSDDKTVYSINSETGKSVWKYQTSGRILPSPIIKDNYIYISSADGFLYRLNSQTGKLIWKKEIGSTVESQIFINHSEIYIANNQGEIMSLNMNGRILWEKSLNSHIYSDINGDEKSIYFGTGQGKVYSLSRKNGNIIWEYDTGSHFISSKPLVLSNQLIIGNTDGLLYSFNKAKGTINWRYKTANQIAANPVYFKNRIFLASDKFYCLNPDGKEVWIYATLSSVDINFTICNNLITLVDSNNNIYSIQAETGSCIKKYTSEDSILSFICVRDTIYAGNEEGEICVLK